MDLSKKSDFHEDLNKAILGLVGGFAVLLTLGGFVVKHLVEKDNFLLIKFSKKTRFWILLDSLVTGGLVSSLGIYLASSVHWSFSIFILGGTIYISGAIAFFFAEFLFKRKLTYRIDHNHLRENLKDCAFLKLENLLNDEKNMPLGISQTSKRVITIPTEERVRHLMITGSNGMGKTSIALTMMRHDLVWNRPIIFLDPKANSLDIEIARGYSNFHGRGEDFLFFSPSDPENSVVYNPLKIGEPAVKADKVIFALGLDHEHWGRVASSFLEIIFEVGDLLNMEITLYDLEELLFSKEKRFSFFEKVNFLAQTKEIEHLQQKIARFDKIKPEEISGLQHGISRLNSSSIRKAINPKLNGNKELDLVEVIEKNKVAYLDVSTNELREIMRQVSRFLVKDLDILSGKLQKGEIKMSSKFVGVYIDEFDTFADKTFHEFLKTARSAKMSITVLFQSVSGLDHIGEHLKEQLATNAAISIHFFTNSKSDLDYISQLPGTMKLKDQSQQIDRNSFNKITGMGTEFSSEVFKLDPNILRELTMDQFVIYQKSQKGARRLDLGKSWSGKKVATKLLNI